MTLAAIDFSYPFMLLIGLLAAGIPVLLHLLNRIRSPIVPFPTLRFLRITAQKTSRRRQLQQWILLLLRMALFAFLGLAVAGPVIGGGSAAFAYGTILLLLVGLALAAMTAVLVATAIDKGKAAAGPASAEDLVAQTKAQTVEAKQTAITRHRPGMYWGMAATAAAVAVLAGGFSLYALGSDRYFTRRADNGFSGRSTACMIVLDNSHSMLAKQEGETHLARAQRFVRTLLLESLRPAEAGLVLTNPNNKGADESTELTAEPAEILRRVMAAEPAGATGAMGERIRKAVEMLKASNQPNKLLLVMGDFQLDAFNDAKVFEAAAGVAGLRVALVPMAEGKTTDLGVTRFDLESGQPAVGTEVTFIAEVINNGENPATQVDFEFLVDGEKAAATRETVEPGRDAKLSRRVTYRLREPGQHRFTFRVSDESGALAWNNSREVFLTVKEQMRALVIGPTAGEPGEPRGRTAAYYTKAALSPYRRDSLPAAGGTTRPAPVWSMKADFREAGDAANTRPMGLSAYDAVFLSDVPKVSEELARALKAYAESGRRVIIQTGPGVDAAAFNATLVKKVGLVPAELGEPVISAEGSRVEFVDTTPETAVFADLYDTLEPFQRGVVTGRWRLAGAAGTAAGGKVLWKLSDGSPLITRYVMGKGEVYLVLTVPSADWSNFAMQPPYIAAVSRMAQSTLGNTRGGAALEVGTQLPAIELPAGAAGGDAAKLFLWSPGAKNADALPPTSPARPRSWSLRLEQAGLWTWADRAVPAEAKYRGSLYLNLPAGEADLTKADEVALAAQINAAAGDPTKGAEAIVARSPADLLRLLKREERSLMAGVLALVTVLLIAEALLANRYRPAVRGVARVEGANSSGGDATPTAQAA